MVIYIIGLGAVCIFGLFIYGTGAPSNAKKRHFINLSMLLIFLFGALRNFKVGLDTEAYVLVYNQIGHGDLPRWELFTWRTLWASRILQSALLT